MITTDPNDPNLRKIKADGQQESYLVLPDAELSMPAQRPFRNSYRHLKCGTVTTMGGTLSRTYQVNPHFYGGTMCVGCGTHFHLRDYNTDSGAAIDGWAFEWTADGEPVGSDMEEAAEYMAEKRRREAEKQAGAGI